LCVLLSVTYTVLCLPVRIVTSPPGYGGRRWTSRRGAEGPMCKDFSIFFLRRLNL
jgi:hypothetical protein